MVLCSLFSKRSSFMNVFMSDKIAREIVLGMSCFLFTWRVYTIVL